MEALKKVSTKIDSFNEKVGKVAAYFSIIMVFITFFVALLRYIFNIGFIFIQESILYFHSMNFLLCSAYALKENYHVKIDILYSRFSPKRKKIMNILGITFLLLPTTTFIFFISLPYVLGSWQYLEGSKEAGGLDLVYILKSNLLIMPFLLFLQGISELIKNILSLKEEIKE